MLQQIATIHEDVLVQDRRSGLSILAGQDLTRREQQVRSLVKAGWSDAQIADLLSLNPLTVRFHATNAMAKLGQSSRQVVADWPRRYRCAEHDKPAKHLRRR
jgi:DNA-binding NarL/FixJ family response regulator